MLNISKKILKILAMILKLYKILMIFWWYVYLNFWIIILQMLCIWLHCFRFRAFVLLYQLILCLGNLILVIICFLSNHCIIVYFQKLMWQAHSVLWRILTTAILMVSIWRQNIKMHCDHLYMFIYDCDVHWNPNLRV